uniref:Ubiquitin carboxyl-terminal hydrolase MINDY n=1 Tax=Amphilophus citrinellus TaxID=61819 RepID=A0A3Q0RYI9_AMPCI
VMVPSVEEVSSSLVREYLSRKGLKRTIACMDEEHPRTGASINNRSQLSLSLISLYHCSLLFFPLIIGLNLYGVLFHRFDITGMFPSQPTNTSLMPAKERKSSNDQTGFWGHTLEVQKDRPLMASLQDDKRLIQREPEKSTSISEITQRSRSNRIRRGMLSGPIPQVLNFLSVLLGSSLNCFSVEWRNQGFTFSDTHDLRYGIVQRKGGPCGVLASVQAFVLKKLLFENSESCNMGLQPSNSTRRKCLVLALAEILWRAGEEKQATIAINSWKNQFTPTRPYKSEGVLEKFETGMLGCMLLTISAILSRSIEKVREDMDVPTTTLIGAHGYCTQELVNLLLCGRAVSNVFDNDMELDSGNGNMTLLKGIKGHCDVGLLSLFEHYNICKVGGYLKTPQYPIWVVCSESHFSVLFGLQRELLTNEDSGPDFDLYYFDGLANQQEEIRLTVSVGKLTQSSHDVDTDLIPPLELYP